MKYGMIGVAIAAMVAGPATAATIQLSLCYTRYPVGGECPADPNLVNDSPRLCTHKGAYYELNIPAAMPMAYFKCSFPGHKDPGDKVAPQFLGIIYLTPSGSGIALGARMAKNDDTLLPSLRSWVSHGRMQLLVCR